MGDVTLEFDDGSAVRLHVFPAQRPESAGPESAPPPQDDGGTGAMELPEGFGTAQPVSRNGRAARALARTGEDLADALRPLGPVLGGIHQSFATLPERPDEVTVEFGVKVGSDLNLAVFTGKGEASFTVSATWRTTPGDDAEGSPAAS
ncbi:CU044_2847 family protein [Streptomyces sp. NPDC052114]|uniref:CU044_2847 family protein n=1 Tax=unclassified Streptomyces TaxID=2593676 RepID=UPI00343B91E8